MAPLIHWPGVAVAHRPVTRFAPAPTGYLHLGHVVNAIYVWGIARAVGGRVLLRVEDHDRQRCRSDYEAALLDDLDWLGLQPDVYPTAAFRTGRCEGRQSDRDGVYRQALERLMQQGLVYGCDCTRRQIEESSVGAGAELKYPGTCREKGLPLIEGIGWRLRLDEQSVAFDDLIHGPTVQRPVEQCGDVLVRDRLGNWTYQFAVAVDDTAQAIDLVVRGDDLFESTARQIVVARLLGRPEPPRFAHHALVMKSPSQKLSKSDRDTGVRDLRAAGWRPSRVLGHAALAVGLRADAGDLAVADLPALVTG